MPKGISHQTENEKKICIRTERSSTTNSSSSRSRKAVQKENWSTRRPPFFHHFSNYSSTPTYVAVVLFVVNQRSKLHTYSAEVPVWHTPVEVAEVRFSMTCSVVDGQGKRGNVHIPAIMSVDFPGVVLDGLRLVVE